MCGWRTALPDPHTPQRQAPRARCPTCLRPHSACICAWATPLAHQVEVLILQHPLEVDHPKGSARLLHLSLPHSRLVVGEVFDEPSLRELLTAPWQDGRAPRQALLLYPETSDHTSSAQKLEPLQSTQIRLVVLDGTWRKSRKMLHQNPLLQQLPRLALHDLPASHYHVRQAHRPDQRSTLEATCAALAQLEGDAARFVPLLAAFDGFVERLEGWQPR